MADVALDARIDYLQEYRGRRRAKARAGMTFPQWAVKIKEAQTGTLDFGRYPYQREPYRVLGRIPNAVVEKGTQVGMCLAPDTKVLRADLQWVPIGEVAPGDELVGVDEDHGGRRARRMRRTIVEARRDVRKPRLRVRFVDGREVVTTPEHRWLARKRGGIEPVWREAGDLRVGDHIRRVCDTWEPGDMEDGWMGDILDGEGSLEARPAGRRLTITQQPGRVLTRAMSYLAERGYTFEHRQEQSTEPPYRPLDRLVVNKLAELFRLVGQTRPTRFTARDDWWVGYRLPGGGRSWCEVESIEPVGEGRMIDLQTSTKTFLAEGLVSHNSTLALRWALWVAGELSGTVMYVFPVKDQVYKFSDQRVKPVIRNSEYLRSLMAHDDPDNKGLKKVGNGYVYFVGSRSVSELDSVPANALVLDEYDELAQVNIPVVLRRVGAADDPMIRYIGVPTLDNYGIESEFRKTDMRRWHVQCWACNFRQTITWDNIAYEVVGPDEYDAKRVCRACGRDIDVAQGEWVAEYPDRNRIGFHVPRLIVPSANLSEVVKGRLSEKEEEQRAHYNRDLAEPFETAESRLAPEAIMSCRRSEIRLVESYVGFNWVTMGIDVSSTRGLHVRISEHLNERVKRVLWVGLVDAVVSANPEHPDQSALRKLAELVRDYKVNMACIDHLPDGLFAQAFCAAHPGRAYMVAYNTDYRARESIKVPKVGSADLLVVIKRTEWITMTLDLFRRQRNLLPLHDVLPRGVEGKTYEEHLRNVVKERKKDTIGREYYGYKDTGAEDFLQAEVYDCAATKVLQQRLMERAVTVQLSREEDVPAPNPTPSLSDWEGEPLAEDAANPQGSTYGSEWGDADEYRP